jgi:hypothetical protein
MMRARTRRVHQVATARRQTDFSPIATLSISTRGRRPAQLRPHTKAVDPRPRGLNAFRSSLQCAGVQNPMQSPASTCGAGEVRRHK